MDRPSDPKALKLDSRRERSFRIKLYETGAHLTSQQGSGLMTRAYARLREGPRKAPRRLNALFAHLINSRNLWPWTLAGRDNRLGHKLLVACLALAS